VSPSVTECCFVNNTIMFRKAVSVGVRALRIPIRTSAVVPNILKTYSIQPVVYVQSPILCVRQFSTTSTEKTAGEAETAAGQPSGESAPEPKSAEEPGVKVGSKDSPGDTKEDLVDVAALQEQLKVAQAEGKKYKNELAYALADIDNVRKISKKDVSTAREYALKGFASDLLDVTDTLDRALSIFPKEAREPSNSSNSIYVGIEMTSSAMQKVMEKHGITRMEIVPNVTEFDPNLHMAVYQEVVDKLPSGIVFNIIKPGYMIKNRVLRPANVGVTSEPEDTPAQ